MQFGNLATVIQIQNLEIAIKSVHLQLLSQQLGQKVGLATQFLLQHED